MVSGPRREEGTLTKKKRGRNIRKTRKLSSESQQKHTASAENRAGPEKVEWST